MLVSAVILLLPDTELPDDRASNQGLSVSLVGYTNVAAGLLSCSYAGTNATTGRFALLRVENSRHRSFRCDGMSLHLHAAGARDSDPELVRLAGPPPFEVAASGAVTVAIPEPLSDARWHVAVLLVPSKSWSGWPRQIRGALSRIGVDTRDVSYIVGSKIYK